MKLHVIGSYFQNIEEYGNEKYCTTVTERVVYTINV